MNTLLLITLIGLVVALHVCRRESTSKAPPAPPRRRPEPVRSFDAELEDLLNEISEPRQPTYVNFQPNDVVASHREAA